MISGMDNPVPAYGWVNYESPHIAFGQETAVLHELFHAIIHQAGHGGVDGAFEERLVQALSYGLMSTLHDNPDFAAWLVESEGKRGDS